MEDWPPPAMLAREDRRRWLRGRPDHVRRRHTVDVASNVARAIASFRAILGGPATGSSATAPADRAGGLDERWRFAPLVGRPGSRARADRQLSDPGGARRAPPLSGRLVGAGGRRRSSILFVPPR